MLDIFEQSCFFYFEFFQSFRFLINRDSCLCLFSERRAFVTLIFHRGLDPRAVEF